MWSNLEYQFGQLSSPIKHKHCIPVANQDSLPRKKIHKIQNVFSFLFLFLLHQKTVILIRQTVTTKIPKEVIKFLTQIYLTDFSINSKAFQFIKAQWRRLPNLSFCIQNSLRGHCWEQIVVIIKPSTCFLIIIVMSP